MNALIFIAVILVLVVGCKPRTEVDPDERKAAARPRNYEHQKFAADGDKPEHWWFSDTPTFWETNQQELVATVNQCLKSVGLPAVTNIGVRDGRIGEVRGGWTYYRWPDYQPGPLKIMFVEEYGMEPGQLRVHTICKPEQLTKQGM